MATILWSEHAVVDANGRRNFSILCCVDKTVKYVTVSFDAYNAVNDCVLKNIKGDKMTGPYVPQKQGKYYGSYILMQTPFYYTQKSIRWVIKSVKVEYMDGTKQTYSGDDIKEIVTKKGCYVATCVYGSYDCPEVWTLRRYRDNTLGYTWYGRLFIKAYYAISPTLVMLFGKTKWFKNLWRRKLDKMVKKLQERGIENTPYCDKEW